MSEGEAYNRIEVARAARRFPVVIEMLADGRVHLTAVRLLAPHLTPDNHHEVLGSARGKTKLEIQEIVARLAPRPDAPASVRRVPAARPEPLPRFAAPAVTDPQVAASLASAPLVSAPPAAAPPATRQPALEVTSAPVRVTRAAVTPLSPERYKLQVTISGETLDKMRLAKDTLSHAIPTGDDAAILSRAFDALLEEAGQAEVRGHRQASCLKGEDRCKPGPHGRGQARRLDARPRTLPLRRAERPSLRGAPLRRVPSHRPARSRRRGERRPHRAALSPSQRLRGEAVFRNAPPHTRTRSRTS
jgi:hypothetical protein